MYTSTLDYTPKNDFVTFGLVEEGLRTCSTHGFDMVWLKLSYFGLKPPVLGSRAMECLRKVVGLKANRCQIHLDLISVMAPKCFTGRERIHFFQDSRDRLVCSFLSFTAVFVVVQ